MKFRFIGTVAYDYSPLVNSIYKCSLDVTVQQVVSREVFLAKMAENPETGKQKSHHRRRFLMDFCSYL